MAYEDIRKKKALEQLAERQLAARNNRPEAEESVEADIDEDKEEYCYYYNRIYPLLRKGLLDYTKLAGETGFKERRIREALLFRLASGEVMQLFGWKEGFCYICSHHHTRLEREPVCPGCLETLDKAIQKTCAKAMQEEFRMPATPEGLPGLKNKPLKPKIVEPSQKKGLLGDYFALLNALMRYREKYFPVFDDPEAEPSAAEENVYPIQAGVPAPAAEEAADFLSILDLNDGDVLDYAASKASSIGAPAAASNVPLRHFGFTRATRQGG